MADTASLVARVKTEGVDQAARQLDDFSAAAAEAEGTASAYARAQAKAASEAKKSIAPVKGLSDITEQLGNKIAILEEAQTNGARSAAILAAQLKAGASASSEEVARIGELTGKLYDLSNQQTKVVTTGKAANDGVGKFKNTAQQAGYQIQDLVVQLQGGTSAFVAIGQQGSQLAGAFGPGGAVLGAVIALASAAGGVLYKSFNDAEVGAKKLEEATRSLQGVLREGSNGALELTDDFLKLAQASNAAAQAKLAASLADAQTQIRAAGQAAAEASTKFDSFFSGNVFGAANDLQKLTSAGMDTAQIIQTIGSYSSASSERVTALRSYVNGLSSDFGITATQALGLVDQLKAVQQTKSPEAVNALAKQLAQLQQQNGTNNAKLNEFNSIIQQAVVDMANGKSALDALNLAYKNYGATLDSIKKKQQQAGENFVASLELQSKRGKELIDGQTQQQIKAIQQREDLTEEQRQRAIAATQRAGELDLKEFEERENQKTQKSEAAGQKRIDAQARRDESEAARQKKAAEDFLAQVDRTSGDEISRITATEQQKLEKLAAFQQQGLIIGQQYEQAKTDIMLTAEDARQEELKKRQEDQAKKQGQHDQYIAEINALNASELELIDVQQKAKEDKAKEFRERSLISEEEYQQSLAEIAENSDKKRIASYSDMLGTTTDNLRTALGEGNKMYKAFAIANAIMNTYQAAVAAYQSAAAIPIVGYIAGPVAAAAAVAAGLANVAKIRSAREQGGNLAAGQISTIAERGKAEVIMPAGASRVRTAQQMKQIMGENTSSNATPNIQIVNQTTGRIDSATTEQDDEGRIVVLIRETVSADMQNSNSSISKSRRATRGQPGYA
jgi:hypothetical protein